MTKVGMMFYEEKIEYAKEYAKEQETKLVKSFVKAGLPVEKLSKLVQCLSPEEAMKIASQEENGM